MRVLLLTSQWPKADQPSWVPFLVREVTALRNKGIQIDVFAFEGKYRPWNYVREWRKLQRNLQEKAYDLIHVQFGQSGLLALFPKKLPLVVTFQGSDLNGIYSTQGRLTLEGFILRKISQLVALRADEVILVSEKLRQFLPRQRCHIIPGGLDLDLFQPIPRQHARKMLNLVAERRYVLFAGGKDNPIKRFGLAKEVVSLLSSECKAELLVANGVIPDQMPLYLNAANVLLLTSSREGSPNIVKEALACNLPVVSVDVGDVRSQLSEVTACVVCDDDHPATIARALETVLVDGKPCNGRDEMQKLDQSIIADRIIKVYQEILFKTQ